MPNNYKFNLTWSDEDEGYIATCPEFPGLSAFGESAQEALSEAQIALQLFIQTYEEKGLDLPAPEKVKEYSGQVSLRLPKSLHAEAARLAKEDDISLNQYLVLAIQAKVAGSRIESRAVDNVDRTFALAAKYVHRFSSSGARELGGSCIVSAPLSLRSSQRGRDLSHYWSSLAITGHLPPLAATVLQPGALPERTQWPTLIAEAPESAECKEPELARAA